jgi:hypothetical protein
VVSLSNHGGSRKNNYYSPLPFDRLRVSGKVLRYLSFNPLFPGLHLPVFPLVVSLSNHGGSRKNNYYRQLPFDRLRVSGKV